MNKIIRWKQRFENFQKAVNQLHTGISIKKPNEIEEQGIIQSFEFSFELAWKTMKDYLESKGLLASFPRDVIKQAFQHDIIEDGSLWLEMLSKRNFLAHTYDEAKANEALRLIRDSYYSALSRLVAYFQKEV